MKKIVYSLLAVTVLVAGGLLVGNFDKVQAYTSAVFSWYEAPHKVCSGFTSTATTTKVAMTPGTGTTTVRLCPDSNDRMALDIIMQASSTNTILAVQIQASADGRDWYPVDIRALDPATTTSGFIPDGAGYLKWKFASSTYESGGVLFTPNNADTVNTEINSTTSAARHIEFNAPVAKQARAVFFLQPFPLGGATTTNANIWVGASVKQNAQ